MKFQSVVSSHLVPVTAVLFIAIVLQVINIFITYCVIRVARKVMLRNGASKMSSFDGVERSYR